MTREITALVPLSKRQHRMLQIMVKRRDNYLKLEEARKFDQRPFRSLLIHRWVTYRPGHGFHISAEGLARWEEYNDPDCCKRLNDQAPLTRFFDPSAYAAQPDSVRALRLHKKTA